MAFTEFPFNGVFYRTYIDETKPLDERVEEQEILLETICDIQQVSQSSGGNFVNASFEVYFPISIAQNLNIKRGNFFEGEMYGMKVNGEIIGIYPSQLGGCTVYLKDIDV